MISDLLRGLERAVVFQIRVDVGGTERVARILAFEVASPRAVESSDKHPAATWIAGELAGLADGRAKQRPNRSATRWMRYK